MLELLVKGTAVFAIHGPLGVTPHNEDHGVARGFEAARAASHVYCGHASRKDRGEYCAGYDVFLRFEKGLHHSMHRRTAGHAAWHLRDDEPRKLDLWMPVALTGQ